MSTANCRFDEETASVPTGHDVETQLAPKLHSGATAGVDLEARPRRGRYLPIAEVGRGAMGQVTRAYDPRLKREVALKSVRVEELSAENARRMLREAQAMAKLSHPNVVAIYDVETHQDGVVIAMEYVRGVTLRQWLQERPSARRSEILSVFVSAGRSGGPCSSRHGHRTSQRGQ